MFVVYLRGGDSNIKKSAKVDEKEDNEQISNSALPVDTSDIQDERSITFENDEHNYEFSFPCVLCDEGFREECELNDHHAFHIGDNSHTCAICLQNFPEESDLLDHPCYLVEKLKICGVCKKTFKSEKSLKKHYILHMSKRPYVCTICEKGFVSDYNLARHYALNKCKLFNCNECQMSFPQAHNLREHKKSHFQLKHQNGIDNDVDQHTNMQAKPFVCDVCGKRFRIRHLLKIHYPIHTGVRAFACSDCGLCFTAERTLNLHYRRFHIGTRSFVCNVCNKAFLFKRELKAHSYKHTEKKPYKCEECGTGFCHKKSLDRHVRVKSCLKSLKCEPSKRRCKKFRKVNRKKILKKKDSILNLKKLKSNLISDDNFNENIPDSIDSVPGFQYEPSEKRHKKSKIVNEKDISLQETYNPSTQTSELTVDLLFKKNVEDSVDLMSGRCVIKSEVDVEICELCNESFEQKSDLHKHYSIHVPELKLRENDQLYSCQGCGESFHSGLLLEKHLQSHFSEKNFACGKCKKIFTNELDLKIHKCINTCRILYICDLCGDEFPTESKCNEHSYSCCEHKPYICDVCNKVFRLKNNLRQHRTLHNFED